MKRKKPIRRVSKRRAAEMKQYSALRKHFLAERPICEVWLKEHGWIYAPLSYEESGERHYEKPPFRAIYPSEHILAMGADRAEEVHHKARRGKNYLNTDTWLAVSSRNHKRIEGQSTYDGKPYGMSWARIQGYLSY